MKKLATAAALSALFSQAALGAPILHSSDFISPEERTHFVDFEPAGAGYAGSSFLQDGVTVTQVNGDFNDTWTACREQCWFSNNSLSWYPASGDFGWTEITKSDGSDFVNIGMDLGGSKFDYTVLLYELLLDGASVLFGSLSLPSTTDGYLGFAGGGFDQVRLRLTLATVGTFGDGALNALAIDNIELSGTASSVPEPTGLALLGLGLAGLGLSRRRTQS